MNDQVKKLVPKLRFHEFVDTDMWQIKQFGNLDLDVSDGNYSSKYPSQSDFTKTGVPFLRANNLKFGTVIDEDMRFISAKQHSEITKGHLKKGDILLTTRGELGTIALVPKRHIGSNINAQLVRVNTANKLINTFLYQLLDYSKILGHFEALSTGTALKQLPISKLNQLSLAIPVTVAEQQKVADCLSSLDDLITAQNQKVEALKEHKKGLMQLLFPAEGETVPKLRFPEFENSGAWEEVSIAQLCETFSGGTPTSTEKSFYDGEIPFIRSAEIASNITELFLTDAGFKNSSAKMVNVGDVLVALYGANSGDVAISRINGAINQAILCLQSDNESRNRFIYQYLTYKKSYIVGKYIQGGQGNLSGEIVKSIKIPQPPKISNDDLELNKIVDCLSSLDELITTQTQTLNELRTHKRGLMQQLFPALEDLEND